MKRFAFLALAATLGPLSFGQFITNGLALSVVGDGSTTLTNAATPTSIRSIAKTGGATQLVATFNSGPTGDRLTNSGTASSEGALVTSSDGQSLTIGGYDATAGTAGVVGTTSSSVNRVVGQVDFAGTVSYSKFSDAFNANNIRSAVTNGAGGIWMAGANEGIRYGTTGPTSTIVSSTSTNNRVVQIIGGDLYFSTGSGSRGIYKINGTPTGTGNTATRIVDVTSSGSPYGFWFADSTTLYVADDRSSATGGIQKWTFNGSNWVNDYTLGTGVTNIGARGLVGEVVAGQNVLYAVTAESSGNRLISITDLGVGSAATTLSTAGVNTIYRGLAMTPVPEPASMIALSLGLAGLVAKRRRKN